MLPMPMRLPIRLIERRARRHNLQLHKSVRLQSCDITHWQAAAASFVRPMTTSVASEDAPLLVPVPEKMNHVTYTPGCTAEGLTITQSPVPEVGNGEVLIRVAYAGVGGTDLAQRLGKFNPKPGCPSHHLIMGLEISGLVVEVGEGVTAFKPGDRVASLLYGGGYAEYAVAPQEQVLELPEQMTLAEGAGVPENFWTVWANLFEPAFGNLLEPAPRSLGLHRAKSLLVHGGAGGIGSTALALASHFNVNPVITTVSSAAKAEAARRFGADVVIDYTQQDFVAATREVTGGAGADVILCFLGGDYTPRNVEALAPHGRLVQLGLRRGQHVSFDFKVLMNKWAMITGGHLRPRSLEQKRTTRDALREHVLPLWRDAKLPMPEVSVLPLAQAAQAHTMLEQSQVIGKIVLRAF